ncbi:MAG: endonuclease/exonuclease/phosphatase family protein, partial [Anaerolineae bacterium]|nr:endonuclease/exonuclease/phosphatase family protein [Anaerolineae bacterium]
MTGTTSVPSATRGRITLRKIFAAAACAYAAVTLIYLLLRVLGALGLPVLDSDSGPFASLVGVGSSLMPALLIPALPLLILAVVWRLPKVVLALAPAVIAFVLLYGPMLLPKPPPAAAETPPLIVYTHNLHVLTEGLADVETEIRASGADVVALQELTEPAAEYLAAALRDVYPYSALNPVGETTHGAGILSKWPLRDTETWITSMVQMRTTVDWPGGTFAFYNLHPPPPRWFLQPFDATDRAAAVNEALRRAGEETLPVILAGDFNLTDQTSDYQAI